MSTVTISNNDEVLRDPSVQKAIEKARRRKKQKSVEQPQRKTDPVSKEQIISSVPLPSENAGGVDTAEQKRLARQAAKVAKQAQSEVERLIQRTFVDVTDVRVVIRNRLKPGYGHFELNDGMHLEYMATHGRSLITSLDADIELIENWWMDTVRRCKGDIKIFGINTPLNTAPYRKEKEALLDRTTNPAYKEMLEEDIEQIRSLDASIHRQLFIAVYGQSIDALQKAKETLASSPVPVYEIPLERQTRLLKKAYKPTCDVDI